MSSLPMGALVVTAVFSAACDREATQLLVYVDSRVVVERVAVELAGEERTLVDITAEELPASFGVLPGSEAFDETFVLRFKGFVGETPEFQASVPLRFEPGEKRHVPVCLRDRCSVSGGGPCELIGEPLEGAPRQTCSADSDASFDGGVAAAGGGGESDAASGGGPGAEADAGVPDASPMTLADASPMTLADASLPAFDAGAPMDMGTPVDAGTPMDATVTPLPAARDCSMPDLAGAIAYWSFDGAQRDRDRIQDRRLVFRDLPANPQAPGPAGCGNGLAFPSGPPPANQQPHAEAPDSPDWDLGTGSIDLWVRAEVLPTAEDRRSMTILTRDATGQLLPGHIGIFINCEQRVVVRLQGQPLQELDGGNYWRASNTPLRAGEWVHIGVNFGAGGLELYVNGERGTTPSFANPFYCAGEDVPLGQATTVSGVKPWEGGIAGNNNDWVFGASNAEQDSMRRSLNRFFRSGAIDSIRISNVRRDFGASP